jgi:four helix bundle protein
MSHSYQDLRVWQKSIDFVTDIYRITQSFPKTEMYGLVPQLRRAAVSVPSNIAEGQGRTTKRDFHRFLGQARGSLLEVETQVVVSSNLGYITADERKALLTDAAAVKAMLNGLMDSLVEIERIEVAASRA